MFEFIFSNEHFGYLLKLEIIYSTNIIVASISIHLSCKEHELNL
jgi:hypothetical protein